MVTFNSEKVRNCEIPFPFYDCVIGPWPRILLLCKLHKYIANTNNEIKAIRRVHTTKRVPITAITFMSLRSFNNLENHSKMNLRYIYGDLWILLRIYPISVWREVLCGFSLGKIQHVESKDTYQLMTLLSSWYFLNL